MPKKPAEYWKKYYAPLEKINSTNPNCVDGRGWIPDQKTPNLAPQALGGSLHFAVLYCLKNGLPLTIENIKATLQELSEKGFALGIHIDDHSKHDPEKSGCGFADNLPDILENIVNLERDIIHTLTQPQILQALKLTEEAVEQLMNTLIRQIQTLLEKKQKIVHGENLLGWLREEPNLGEKLVVYELKGNHGEKAALVNLQEGTTFNTIKAARDGNQAFNLDLPYVLEGAQALGVDEAFAKVASLALYVATERTLREGKEQLPIVIIKS